MAEDLALRRSLARSLARRPFLFLFEESLKRTLRLGRELTETTD